MPGIGESAETVFFAFLTGLIPVLVWLAFWLFEDRRQPEPRWLLLFAFVSGMVGVVIVLPFQQIAASYLAMGFPLLLSWAAIEEIVKFGIAWVVVLRRRAVDEPIDIPIYIITTALGFSALENALFVFHPIALRHISESLVTGDLRFIGATLIHVLSSSIIAGALAITYYRERLEKILYGTLGVILAILLHGFFNFLILITGSSGVLTVFLGVWFGIIFLLLAFERIKSIHRPRWWEKIFIKRNAE